MRSNPANKKATIPYRCPTSGRQVRGWNADDPLRQDETYQSVTCSACGWLHRINPKTGYVVATADR